MALAATLIHEIMHCVLININNRARANDPQAISAIEKFNKRIKDPSSFSGNPFFALMNCGEKGQHELMYQLFYPDMVLLLERFAQIHKPNLWYGKNAGFLMWSGLQQTTEFQKLNFDEQKEINLTILSEKGFSAYFSE